jgi:hypothetical protein
MPILKGHNGLEMVWFSEDLRMHYVKHLSDQIKDKFGNGPFLNSTEVKPILQFLFDNLITQAKVFLSGERSLAFYQYIQILHEDSNNVVINHSVEKVFPAVTQDDFSMYRRILRFILEQSTCIPLIFRESLDQVKVRSLPKLEELIHIVYLLFSYSNLQASDSLLGNNSIDLSFNNDGLYILDYKFPINKTIFYCNLLNYELRKGAIIDENAHSDFNDFFKQHHGAELFYLVNLIEKMHIEDAKSKDEPFPHARAFDLESLVSNYAFNTSINPDISEKIISGLILSESTKCSFEESIFQPHNIKRHLFRPFIQWKIVNHPPMIVVSKLTLQQSLNSLAINAIGWQKYPDEWSDDVFTLFVLKKSENNGAILEDEIEKKLKSFSLIYDRNITTLYDKNGQGSNIENESCGEVDFIFIKDKIIYICDSKYLLDRHDFNNWKADYSKFVNGKKNYNDVLSRKKVYLESIKSRVFEHLEFKTGHVIVNKDELYFDIFFIINTPTFYMYNSPIQIIPITALEAKIKGEEVYPQVEIETNGGEKVIVKHPYFK